VPWFDGVFKLEHLNFGDLFLKALSFNYKTLQLPVNQGISRNA
jgi:hypothetical protein